eukprot:gene7738-8549_t
MEESLRALVVRSGFLSLADYVKLQWISRAPYNWLDFWQSAGEERDGRRRCRQWLYALLSSDLLDMNYLRHSQLAKQLRWRLEPNGDSRIDPDSLGELYRRTVAEIDFSSVSKLSSGVEGEVVRDVVRTFQREQFFRGGPGRHFLTRVLLAFARCCPEMGYCQGMNYVVAALIVGRLGMEATISSTPPPPATPPPQLSDEEVLQAESDVFSVFYAMVYSEKLSLRGLWAPRLPQLKLRVYHLDRLTRWQLPGLHAHLSAMQISPEVLAAQWLLTVFAYALPLPLLLRCYDAICTGGWPVVYGLALALLSFGQKHLLAAKEMEGVAIFLKKWNIVTPSPAPPPPAALLSAEEEEEEDYKIALSPDLLLGTASRLLVGQEAISKLSEAFGADLLALGRLRLKELASSSSTSTSPLPGTSVGNTGDSLTNTSSTTSSSVTEKKSAEVVLAEDRDSFSSTSSSATSSSSCQPVFWLARYAYKLTPEVARELVAIDRDLRQLDHSIDEDKEVLQQKIVHVCVVHREAEEEAQRQAEALRELQHRLEVLDRQAQEEVVRAKEVYRLAHTGPLRHLFLQHSRKNDRVNGNGRAPSVDEKHNTIEQQEEVHATVPPPPPHSPPTRIFETLLSSSTNTNTSSTQKKQLQELRSIEASSQQAQQQIIAKQRACESCRREVDQVARALRSAWELAEESSLRKKTLCDQLQLLVEDSNRGRSQKLLFVANHFSV